MSGAGWRSGLTLSLPIKEKLFTVAILGKPNVGKSTLFNRLLERRHSITDATPGVTRDVVESELTIKGRRIRLLDTGGYTVRSGPIERLVARRSAAMAESSDLLLMVVEAGGLTREDLDLIARLRRHENKVVLVVNKVDGPKQEQAMGDFYGLGLHRLIEVSAAHGRNIKPLLSLIYEASLRSAAGAPEGGPPAPEAAETAGPQLRLTILGKPNTGKSTLLNLLMQEEKAIVTEIPGTTRDPITGRFSYKNKFFLVIDTAGIRRKSRVSQAVEYYSVNRAIKSIHEADIVVLLVDAQEGVSDQDKKIASLAVNQGRGVILALNKCDLLGGEARELPAVQEKVRFFFPALEFAPLVPISARTGNGVGKLLDTALAVWEQLKHRVATNRLNQAVERWVSEYPLPVRGKNVKIRYATQTSANPVKFLFFVNNLKLFPSRYSKYLKNRIREDLGFDKIPVEIDFRES